MSEARFGHARCPGCGGALEPLGEALVPASGRDAPSTASAERLPPLSVCTACFGIWFEWWAGETSAICKTLRELPRTTRAGVRGDGACPRDRTLLHSQAYLDSGPVVRRCPRCMGLFAGRAHIDELATFADRMPDHPGPIVTPTLLGRLWRLFA